MKITKNKLKQMIKEELSRVLNEYEEQTDYSVGMIKPSEIDQQLRDNPEILSNENQSIHYLTLKPGSLATFDNTIYIGAVGTIKNKEELRKKKQMAYGYWLGSLDGAKNAAFRMSQEYNRKTTERFESLHSGGLHGERNLKKYLEELEEAAGDPDSVVVI
tara:strand:- start:26 stop:505 length:480 start_codon:yes stop_codon:yes gene_type:complete